MAEVILLEKLSHYGNIGDLVEVKGGFARNYLFPRKKAMRATEANKAIFEARREEIEKENKLKFEEASRNAKLIGECTLFVEKEADDDGKLYGAVSVKEIIAALEKEKNIKITAESVILNKIKEIGIYDVDIKLHGDVNIIINLNVCRPGMEDNIRKMTNNNDKNDKSKLTKNPSYKKSYNDDIGDTADISNINDIEEGIEDEDNELPLLIFK